MTEPTSKAAEVTSEDFRAVIGQFATGVTVITTSDGNRSYGATASAVSSLSLEPPMLLVCINRESTTGQAIAREGRFAVNILAESQDHLARRFARRDPDKFQGISFTDGEHGEPLLDGALAHLECRVTEQVLGGTHTVFLGEVYRASGRTGAPLAYFRGQFGRLQLSQDEHAHTVLRTAIIERSIAIGQPLDIAGISEQFDVPERSAQHALMRLLDEGLVRQEDDGSFVVVPLTFAVIEDAFRARLTAQLGAAMLSVGHLSEEHLGELRQFMEATIPVAGGQRMSPSEWFEANQQFHEQMLRAADSEALIAAYRRFTVPGLMTRSLDPEEAVNDDVASEHIALMAAFEAGDLQAACDAIRRDNEGAIEFHRERMQRVGGLV